MKEILPLKLNSPYHTGAACPKRLFTYWGKALNADAEPQFHPLVFHSLDVAAVAVSYLRRHDALRKQFAAWLGTSENSTSSLIAFLAAIHDLGKFADNFQWKRADLVEGFGVTGSSNCNDHHDSVSRSFWFWAESRIQPILDAHVNGMEREHWETLAHAVIGHHGKPPASARDFSGAMFDPSRADAIEFVKVCAQLFLPELISVHASDKAIARFSWSLSGLAVLCDWIGSNTDWFKYREAAEFDHDLGRYWVHAQKQAEVAIAAAGVCAQPALPFTGAVNLLESLKGRELRPAQQLVESLSLESGPQLFVLEDATGSGKTEAALALCARLMGAGMADGFYFALPTQATADQMFERIAISMGRLFAEPRRVTCVLSHSAREQHSWFSAMRNRADDADAVPNEEDTASFWVSEWLGQSNKRALIAQLGAGTIDQCMLGVLRVKHQSLRLLGLQRKVLIIDEVHSYDAYIASILGELIQTQAALGGSVILLSATLSADTRGRVINRFLAGLGPKGATYTENPHAPYPLLTRTTSVGAVQAHKIDESLGSQRRIEVDYLDSPDAVLAQIHVWLAAGKAVVWIRNAVGDAIDAYRQLRPTYGERCTLFHSRFALIDRQRVQCSVLSDLGKESNASSRRGRLVIATQVLSQSLDLDADEMVCDLAPIDEMLQRQGRLRRHVRDTDGRAIASELVADDVRGPIRLTVFGPTPSDSPEANWYRQFSPRAARVYEDHGRLWLATRCIRQGLNLPQDFRSLVDLVYDPDAEIPTALSRASDRADGRAAGEGQSGRMGCIKFSDGFTDNGDWCDEERIVTRLGQSIEAVLAHMQGAKLLPWAADKNGDGWSLSAVRIPIWWLCADGESVGERWMPVDQQVAELVQVTQQSHARLKYRVIVVLEQGANGQWTARTRGGVTLTYDRKLGLGYERHKI